MSDTRLSSSIISLGPLFLQSILSSGPKSVSSMSTQLRDFWMHLCPWRMRVISVKQQRTTGMKVYKIGMIVALYVHTNVCFLPAKVLVTQVFSTELRVPILKFSFYVHFKIA